MNGRGAVERYLSATSIQRESIGNLIGELAVQSANLVRDEIALVSRELQERGKKMQAALLLIVLGAAFALVALQAFCVTVVLLLSEYLKPWQSALIVCGGLAIVSGALIAFGISGLRRTDFKPTQTIETLEENKEWLKEIT